MEIDQLSEMIGWIIQQMLSIFTKIQCQTQLTKLKGQIQKQSRGYRELYQTETHYVSFLLFVKDQFQKIIQQLGLSLQLYQQLFRGVDKIYELHRQLFQAFGNVTSHTSKCMVLSQVFDKYIPYFMIYKDYFDTLEYRRELVAELKQKEKLDHYGKTLRKYVENPKIKEKYGPEFLSYISKIELMDCLSKPFHRYHQYQLLIDNYIQYVNPRSKYLKNIKATSQLLKSEINKINSNLATSNQKTVVALDKKYGGLMRLHAIYYENMKVEWYHRSKTSAGRLYVFDKVLLIVSEDNKEKELKRIIIGEHSYFHHLRVGRNFTTEIFIKGRDEHLTLFVLPERFERFSRLIENLIGGANYRKSWEEDIMNPKKYFDVSNNCVIFRPVNLVKHKGKYRYGVSFQIEGTNRVALSFFSVNRLKSIAETMIDAGYDVETLQEATGVDLEGEIDEYYAEQLALGLFEYFSPLLSNFGQFRKNERLQTQLNLDECMTWFLHKEKDGDGNDQNELFSLQQNRLRLSYDPREYPCVQVNIWISHSRNIKMKIGKNQRVYQVVKSIFGQKDFTFDFTLFTGESRNSCRLLDDDEILYEVLKEDGCSFPQEQNFIMKGLNLLTRKQQPNLYLRKYLYFESNFINTYINQSHKRIFFLVEDIIEKLTQNAHSINGYKMIERLGMLFALTTKQLNSENEKVVNGIWASVQTHHYQLSESTFKSGIQSKFLEYLNHNPANIVSQLLGQLRYCRWYSFNLSGKLNGNLVNIYVNLDQIEVRQWETPQKSIFIIQIKDLCFSVAPSYVKIRDISNDYLIEADDVYGLILALERNINANKLLQ